MMGTTRQWTATVPVYADDDGSCINANTAIRVVGFAKIIVKMPGIRRRELQ